MSDVTQTFFERWFSRRHVGAARPQLIVGVRKGSFFRSYQHHTFLNGTSERIGLIPGESAYRPWWPKWTPQGDYHYIPGVRSADLSKSLQNNGLMSATITVDNVVVKSRTGVAGFLFRVFKRGALAPYYGVTLEGRPPQTIEPDPDWHNLLDSEAQITVWEGYGDELSKTFTGIVDGPIDMTSQPSVMTIQARDFGQMLTDSRLMGYNKSPQLTPPITFADRRSTEITEAVSGGAKASSEHAGHPATNVSDMDSSTTWESEGHSVRNVTEWIDIRLPRGAYETFFTYLAMNDMEMYLSVFAHGDDPKMDGGSIPTGWVDTGLGDVPGDNGGFPYIKHWDTTSDDRGYTHTMGHRFFLGDNSVLRLSFRNLGPSKDADGNRTYRAAVRRLAGIVREIKEDTSSPKKQILVDDASEIVKIVLRWAGFREWEVEDFGWRLKDPLVFHQGDLLIDIINKLATYGAFNFFMGDPTAHDLSTGVPIFRYSRARKGAPLLMVQVTDQDHITAMTGKLDRQAKAYIIRARGKLTKKGVANGEDAPKRFAAVYRPPWTRGGRNAGKITQETFTDLLLTSNAQCMVAACLTAFQMALASTEVAVQIAGYPALDIDDQIGATDEGTGTNSRVYVVSRSSSHTTGKEATWRMTLTGALLDVPDVQTVIQDLNQAVVVAAAEEDQK